MNDHQRERIISTMAWYLILAGIVVLAFAIYIGAVGA